MSKRKFTDITDTELLLEFDRLTKRQKTMPALSTKRILSNKRRRTGSLTTQINRVIDRRIETKFNVDNFSQVDILNTPMFQEVTAITQGTAEGQRVGNQINPTYVESKLGFALTAATSGSSFVRVMVVQSRREALVVGDMPTGFGEAPDYDQMNIFYDMLLQVRNVGGDSETNVFPLLAWNYHKVLKRATGVKQTVQYDSNDGNAAAGGIYIFAISGDANMDVVDGYITLKYKDG